MNFSYLHQPGHHRNPKNPLTPQTWTLEQKQRKKVPYWIMVQCCQVPFDKYFFLRGFKKLYNLWMDNFLSFATPNYWDCSSLVFLLLNLNNCIIFFYLSQNTGKPTFENVVGKICSHDEPEFHCLLHTVHLYD